ncbi:hypothetical protein U9M48_042737 [Paspalum notatum var. saurae]|uniref:CCHC-type domain-containing protein n=1 Tax=Paspalum notatum var. saurae TaxID=547442 RepID=A0AAQ3XHX8_PASNO
MRDSLACTGSNSLALATPSSESVTNSMLHNFSFSALMSVTEEQLATLGDDELCLVSSRFQRAYDNRMSKKRGERPKCFECGEVGHFIAECPNKNDYYKKGKSYSRDSDKYHFGKAGFDKHRSSKHGSGKRPFGKKNFQKAFKSYQKDNRKRDKAFFAEIGFCSSGSCSSLSSSSSSDEEITYRKDKRNDQGGPAGLCFVSTKSKRKNKEKRSLVCSMALEDKEDKDDGSNSSSDDEDRGMEDVWIMDSAGPTRQRNDRFPPARLENPTAVGPTLTRLHRPAAPVHWTASTPSPPASFPSPSRARGRRALPAPRVADAGRPTPRPCLSPMSREFEMSLMGELQFLLGLQIKQGL